MKTFDAHLLLSVVLTVSFAGGSIAWSSPVVRAISHVDPYITPCVTGAGESFFPIISLDGQFVVFSSNANNLVTNDDNSLHLDLFIRDLKQGTTTLVSVDNSGTGGGNGDSILTSISANGRFVAFESEASNLITNDVNSVGDVFVWDSAGKTSLVSVNQSGTRSGNGKSSNPSITPDGQFVVFESLAPDLAGDDRNGSSDVFLRDLANESTRLVSISVNGSSSGNGASDSPAITPDGRFVAFVSTATDLVSQRTDAARHIFFRDLLTETTTWLSSDVAALAKVQVQCQDPLVSDNGRYVAFTATAVSTNLSFIFRRDMLAGTALLIQSSETAALAGMSTDGERIAFESAAQVFVWDALKNTNILVSVNHNGTAPASGLSQKPVISKDGLYVLFLSDATDLVEAVADGSFQLYLRDLVSGSSRLISTNRFGLPGGDVSYVFPSMSRDARLVVFESWDENMVQDDSNHTSDVFVNDLTTGETRLVSRRDDRLPALMGDGLSSTSNERSIISEDGMRIVFSSTAGNLVTNDFNNVRDVFLHDIAQGKNTLITLNMNGVAAGIGEYSEYGSGHCISADGRFVAFSTDAAGIVPNDTNRAPDIFLRDLSTSSTTLISVNRQGTSSGNAHSWGPVVSQNGRFVAFISRATDLVTNLNIRFIGAPGLFLRDTTTGLTTLVNANVPQYESPVMTPDGSYLAYRAATYSATQALPNPLFISSASATEVIRLEIPGFATTLSISEDGRTVAFGYHFGYQSWANSFRNAYVARLGAGEPSLVSGLPTGLASTNTLEVAPQMNADGRFIVFVSNDDRLVSNDSNRMSDVFVRDLQTATTTLVSVNALGFNSGNGASDSPAISADGRYVVFASTASNLTLDNRPTNGIPNIFLRDLRSGATMLVSRNKSDTGGGNAASSQPLISRNGRTIIFTSEASDLVAGDYNNVPDLFYVRVDDPFVDTDGDGMDDDWERMWFGGLSRSGRDDYDGDGATDLDEFLAGTNPTQKPYSLKITQLIPKTAVNRTVLWLALPGRTYRVQYKNDLNDPVWSSLEGAINSIGYSASKIDFTATGRSQRFYRVVSP